MNRERWLVLILGLVSGLWTTVQAQVVGPEPSTWTRLTAGGAGGRVIKVTNLAAEGPGSFAAALTQTGPRIIVFEVAGVIDLNKKQLTLREPFVTIAGQTAPSPGITLIRGGLTITTHDVVMKHLRFRMGDAGTAKKAGFEPDVSTAGKNAYNVWIDHCSFAWAVDENLSVSGPRTDGPQATSHRVTLSSNFITEGLYSSVHEKGIHSMGTLVHDCCTDVVVIGNFYAHNNDRNPYFKALTTGLVANNLIYNPGNAAIRVDWAPEEWVGFSLKPGPAQLSIVGNVCRAGPNSPTTLALVNSRAGTGGLIWLQDNLTFDKLGRSLPLTKGPLTVLPQPPYDAKGFRPIPANQVEEAVLTYAGARPRDRDATDERLVREYRERGGKWRDSQDQVGGYPRSEPTARLLDVPTTGIDQWLEALSAELEQGKR